MDFDDIIVWTVRLFEQSPDVLSFYQHKFKYIMVDEYQDTNHAQYMLVKLLSSAHRNICVVGDDNQSIYRFRGATIENILSFEQQYKDAFTVRLEQNYRSTGNILDAANAVIKHNANQKEKIFGRNTERATKSRFSPPPTNSARHDMLPRQFSTGSKTAEKFSDNAVLYRMNAMSNNLESAFMRSAIPYRIIGGTKFYDRKGNQGRPCISPPCGQSRRQSAFPPHYKRAQKRNRRHFARKTFRHCRHPRNKYVRGGKPRRRV